MNMWKVRVQVEDIYNGNYLLEETVAADSDYVALAKVVTRHNLSSENIGKITVNLVED